MDRAGKYPFSPVFPAAGPDCNPSGFALDFRSMLDLRLLSHALALAEQGSFARAARAIHLSQPALSRSIQTLESQLGIRLFERDRKGIQPTDAGHLVLARARSLSLQSADLEREIGILQKGGGVGVRVASGPYPAQLLVGHALARCLKAVPGFRAKVVVDAWPKVIQMVQDREADLGVCEVSDMTMPEMQALPLRRRQGHAVARCGHPLATKPSLAMRDLLEYPLVFTNRLPPRVLGKLLPPGSQQSPPSIRCESLQVTADIIKGCDAIAFFPDTMVHTEVMSNELVPLDFAPDWLHSAFHLIRIRERVVSPAAAMVWEMILEVDTTLD